MYEVIDGYLRVYNSFDTYRTFWIIDTLIESLIKPKSYDAVSKYPFMVLVKPDELGEVEGVEVAVTLYANIRDINTITKLLKDEDFKGQLAVSRVEVFIGLCRSSHLGEGI